MSKHREPPNDDPLWYKDAVIYQLRVRSFFDGNGDGIGDFQGLTAKLDYLESLGVTTIWMLPFYPSPMRDDGYDIADYVDVHADTGTLADFKQFLAEAHARGLRVITELVINHTSDQHPWFQRARRAPPGSPERGFYVWSDTPDKWTEARIIFPDFEPSNWSWDPLAKQYYWHRFFAHQPDLNFENPAVQQAVLDAMDFWLEMGVDGLRLDAIPYLYEREGTNCENLPETHAFLQRLRAHVDGKYKNRMLLAEANQWPEDAVAYLSPRECHMAFHFPIMPRLYMALRTEDRFPITDILAQTPALDPTNQWAIFLRNHDELTLEMVTDEERDYMWRVYARDARARINLGIRRRLAPLMGNDRRQIELLNGLLFSLPGTPVLYYGDEIGMGDNVWLGDRDGVRTPMQWSSDRNAGFSRANPQKLVLPVIIDPEYHYETVNVEAQDNNPSSLLWWTRRLISMRKRFRAFGRGDIRFLQPENAKILAFVRTYEEAGKKERVLVVANLSRFHQYVELDLSEWKDLVPVEQMGGTPFPPVGSQPWILTLGPHGFTWFSLQDPTSVQSSTGERALARATATFEPPAISAENPSPLLAGAERAAVESILPSWLAERPWSRGGRFARPITAEIQDVLRVPGALHTSLALVRVGFGEVEPELWLQPFGLAENARAQEVRERWPEAAIATFVTPSQRLLLYDAIVDTDFAKALLAAIENRLPLTGARGEARGTLGAGRAPVGAAEPRLLRGEHKNSLLVHDEKLLLKTFRRLDEGPSPELEMVRTLGARGFANVPAYAGTLEYRAGRGAPIALALLHDFVPNQGDAWSWSLDELKRFFERALTQKDASQYAPTRPLADVLVEATAPASAAEAVGFHLDAVALLGRRVAEMHLLLASPTEDPAFSPEVYTTLYQRSSYQSMRNLANQVFRKLRTARLPEDARPLAESLRKSEHRVLERFGAFLARKVGMPRVRIHGDLHLGDVLWTGKDFLILDFEGDRSRTLPDRRRKRAPLRDVVSLIRSFHFAAQIALRDRLAQQVGGEKERASLASAADAWSAWTGWALLHSWLQTAERIAPKEKEELRVLLDAFLLERALYEVGYEIDVRPERVAIALHGALQVLGGA